MSHTVYLYNLYSLIEECYYQTTFPPPLSILERFIEMLVLMVKRCRRGCTPRDRVQEDSFSESQTDLTLCLDILLSFLTV